MFGSFKGPGERHAMVGDVRGGHGLMTVIGPVSNRGQDAL